MFKNNQRSISRRGNKNPMYGLRGKLSPNFGSKRTKKSLLKMSMARHNYYKTHKHPLLGICGKHSPTFGSKRTKEIKLKMSLAMKKHHRLHPSLKGINSPMYGKKHSMKTKLKISQSHRGVIFSKKHRQRLSKNKIEYFKTHRHPMLGKRHTKESRKKMRLSALNYISICKNNGDLVRPKTGLHETQILNYIEKLIGIKLKRQFTIDGYFIDGYDEQNNIVYEVDESHHHNLKQKKKDKEREKYIKNKLKCKFIRLDEKEYLEKINKVTK